MVCRHVRRLQGSNSKQQSLSAACRCKEMQTSRHAVLRGLCGAPSTMQSGRGLSFPAAHLSMVSPTNRLPTYLLAVVVRLLIAPDVRRHKVALRQWEADSKYREAVSC